MGVLRGKICLQRYRIFGLRSFIPTPGWFLGIFFCEVFAYIDPADFDHTIRYFDGGYDTKRPHERKRLLNMNG